MPSVTKMFAILQYTPKNFKVDGSKWQMCSQNCSFLIPQTRQVFSTVMFCKMQTNLPGAINGMNVFFPNYNRPWFLPFWRQGPQECRARHLSRGPRSGMYLTPQPSGMRRLAATLSSNSSALNLVKPHFLEM